MPACFLLALSAMLIIPGCTSVNNREYAPFVRDLDGKNLLEISTYPGGYPKRLYKKGSILEKYETHDQLYFQVFIRDKKKKMGVHPHIQSINIDFFSYQVGDETPTVLLSDYDHNFWMQDNPRYEQRQLAPIPYVSDGKVSIEIDFTLNGRRYTFRGDMPAVESRSVLPTFIVNQGV